MSAKPRMPNVLVVDDNEVDREHLRRLLRGRHHIVEAATAGEGVSIAGAQQLDCVLLDYRLPDQDGTDVISAFQERGVPVLMLTSQGSEIIAVEAMKRGADDYLNKGLVDGEQLERAIDVAIDRHRLRRELYRQREELERAVTELEAKKGELEKSNRALAQSETRLRVILQQLPAIAWTTGKDLGLRSMSGAALRTLGRIEPPAVGTPIVAEAALIGNSVEAVDAHRTALSGDRARFKVKVGDHTLECSVEPLRDDGGRITGVIGVALDVTELTRLAQRLAHAAKMEAIGMLAGGVAHDFNNLLTAIVGFTEFAQERLPVDSPSHGDLAEALNAAERAVDLVRQLLTFSRREPANSPEDVDVHDCVARLIPMLRRVVRENIQIELAPAEPLWIRIDRRALEQLVVNLVVNARDAMSDGGRVQLAVAPIDLRGGLFGPGARPLTGPFVQLSVADEGTGIPPDVVDRIFEPFFTTKAPGRGTGLGLSTCYALAQHNGGTITVDSHPGGTTFRVLLPRTVAPSVKEVATEKEVPGGAETILLVEDDAQVRAVVSRMLRNMGYAVLVAPDGPAAVDAARLHPGPIDLVLSDVVMPHMDGATAVRLLREVRPGLRALFMSGYVDRGGRPATLPPDAAVIEKPLLMGNLAQRLRQILDVPQGTPGATARRGMPQ